SASTKTTAAVFCMTSLLFRGRGWRRRAGARRRGRRKLPAVGVAGRVERTIANRLAFFVDEHQRLLKQSGRGRAFRHRRLGHVETRPVPVNFSERARRVGVRQLNAQALDLIDDGPAEEIDLRAVTPDE